MTVFWHADHEDMQDPSVISHLGGLPILPQRLVLPRSLETNEAMTFFFSIDLSFVLGWQGKVMSVFATTTYFDENDCIPQNFSSNKNNYDIPSGALDSYQRQFKIFVTEWSEAVIRDDYVPRIRYNILHESDNMPDNVVSFGKRNVVPDWILEDETPGTYGGTESFDFIFQTCEDYSYSVVVGAPRQMLPDYTQNSGKMIPSLVESYDLWVSNAAFFFITKTSKILSVVQSD